ncbi:dihydroorotate dehydrogenase [Labrenzia sp. C1B10]|nr:dihydroorotate dehydrogenase [Labrenzia sp. C1B10]ERP99668.1 dihydroorotate dehydrogenase [Labrenzia sp. C1B70]
MPSPARGKGRQMTLIFKIVPKSMWQEATDQGVFKGAPVDLQDGFIHFSAEDQVRETAAKHFAGQQDLLLAAFDADGFGDLLKWETSRGGALFPHLYGSLDPKVALWVKELPLSPDGSHDFPELDQ